MVAVVLAALLFWLCVFMIYFTSQGVSPIDFFAGPYAPHDAELAQWKETGQDEGGLLREPRLLLPEGRESARYLERQPRYRDPRTRAILRTEPAVRVPRRRI